MANLIVTAAEIASIVAACAVAHPVVKEAPLPEVVFHAQAESRMHRFAVGVNKDDARRLPAVSESFATEAQAVSFAAAMLRAGRSIDVGVMQVNLRAHPIGNVPGASFPSLEAAFDVGLNVCYGARVLGDAYKVRREARCIYNTGRPNCSNGYPEGIDRAGRLVAARLTGDVTGAPERAPDGLNPPAASPPPPPPPRPRPAGTAFQRVHPAPERPSPSAAGTEAPAAEPSTRLAENDRP